ncbi:MAG: ribosomal L7Ae/L30e/S12e/Gadd45 family protein [Thermoplasmatales archaeon]|jgi:ribosomal protein L30E|nr:ribosomal L7Ae/L30e/S12e/Gadd45 family protein [Candidatus Thermoplasmatota archaeon]MCL6002616.1 ribosomal L7Ae/L30e/S12e/Gadd45 family protein [Candidatus Thermoplasmatota archaeon]MDA8054599.1 ribosomal L7Ae/L30e/S12e/Gadd45 family protein [Thermoplasmatales archaeon]
MDYNWELRRLKETGKFVLGEKTTEKLVKKGGIKAIVYADEPHLKAKYEQIKTLKFAVPLNSIQLGNVFGKPFPVSVVGVIDSGVSQFRENE